MKAVVEIATGRALYLFPDSTPVAITERGMTTPTVRAVDVRADTHTVVENVTEPPVWVGGALAWVDSAWVVLDQARLDERLNSVKSAAHDAIDKAAGDARARYITVAPGQEVTYLAKEREARDFASGGTGPWPILEAEAAALGIAVADLAALVIQTADAWWPKAAAIEAARRAGKESVNAATSVAAVHAAQAAAIAQLAEM